MLNFHAPAARLAAVLLITATFAAVDAQACKFKKLACPAPYNVKKGLTWGLFDGLNQAPSPSVGAGCGTCDPYMGDTSCCEKRPILCIKKVNSPSPSPWYSAPVPQPLTTPGGALANYWSGGIVAATCPYYGWQLTSLAVANQFCAAAFGAGFRMAEHHDGAPTTVFNGAYGWSFFGTEAATPSGLQYRTRHWTSIIGTTANCWDV